MSFFDKLFSNKSRNSNDENGLKSETERLRFRSSHLNISKEQIRFVLFRECDKRGRKLLFDSNSVEKVKLPTKENMCNLKCQQRCEFIETSKTHGYKYNKPSSDVSSLGELVFGSVAVIYKGESSFKIHSIPSPKRLMFTTIKHAPSRCTGSFTSDLNSDQNSKASSLSDILNQQTTSSSDSKLYKHESVAQKHSSTYPWIKHSFPASKIKQCCEKSDVDSKLTYFLNESSDLRGLESVSPNERTKDSSNQSVKLSCDRFCSRENYSMINTNCCCQKSFECKEASPNNCDSSGITSNESENFSSVSGSLSSLRRRWIHSYSTSLDSTAYDDNSSSPSKKRTKLGMALIFDLSNTLEDEVEKLLFNHTIIIDSAMAKLQSSVEVAYIRNENFVDLIYTAFLECQESIHELITGGKYERPMWFTVLDSSSNLVEPQWSGMSLYGRNIGTWKKQNLMNNLQSKFLNDFWDALIKFDTKDTNFFISTLLTAVLTHHLSWVNSFAETDLKSSKEKLSVINNTRPYNPIWAQMNDLCGLLGSPLKSVKTVITGSSSKKNQLASILQILSYFIRCNNVLENVFEMNVEDIIGNADSESKDPNHDSGLVPNTDSIPPEKNVCVSEVGESNKVNLLKESDFLKTPSMGTGLKRSKSCLSQLKPNELYPDIKDLAKSENIKIEDLNYVGNSVENFLGCKKLKEKIQKMIKVPNKILKPRSEEHLSLDEGYDTIDLAKTDDFTVHKTQMERQYSAVQSRKEDVIFMLGENEKLVNLQKKVVVNKSSFIDMEKEDSRDFLTDVPNTSEKSRTLCDSFEKTFRVSDNCEKVGEEVSNHEDRCNVPWIVKEFKMPRVSEPCLTRTLEVSSVLGGVNEHFNPEQIIQAVTEPKTALEEQFQKDLWLCAHNPILEKNVNEALCIIGDMESWEVSVLSTNTSTTNWKKQSEVRVGMSQLVADMLESFLHLHSCNLPPSFCLRHIEKKLNEIYLRSKTVAELLNSTELCSIDFLVTKLDIGINDVPLLLSVATMHSPHLAEKYVLSFS